MVSGLMMTVLLRLTFPTPTGLNCGKGIPEEGCQLLFLPSYSPDLTLLKKPSRSSKRPCTEQVPEPEKPWKKLLDKRYSLSWLRMLRDGFSIAGIFFLREKGRVNMVQSFGTPL